MKKNYTHNLTIEELKELSLIRDMLKSNDNESYKLAIGLLKNYPPNLQINKQNLEEILNLINNDGARFLMLCRLILGIGRILNTKSYYVHNS